MDNTRLLITAAGILLIIGAVQFSGLFAFTGQNAIRMGGCSYSQSGDTQFTMSGCNTIESDNTIGGGGPEVFETSIPWQDGGVMDKRDGKIGWDPLGDWWLEWQRKYLDEFRGFSMDAFTIKREDGADNRMILCTDSQALWDLMKTEGKSVVTTATCGVTPPDVEAESGWGIRLGGSIPERAVRILRESGSCNLERVTWVKNPDDHNTLKDSIEDVSGDLVSVGNEWRCRYDISDSVKPKDEALIDSHQLHPDSEVVGDDEFLRADLNDEWNVGSQSITLTGVDFAEETTTPPTENGQNGENEVETPTIIERIIFTIQNIWNQITLLLT